MIAVTLPKSTWWLVSWLRRRSRRIYWIWTAVSCGLAVNRMRNVWVTLLQWFRGVCSCRHLGFRLVITKLCDLGIGFIFQRWELGSALNFLLKLLHFLRELLVLLLVVFDQVTQLVLIIRTPELRLRLQSSAVASWRKQLGLRPWQVRVLWVMQCLLTIILLPWSELLCLVEDLVTVVNTIEIRRIFFHKISQWIIKILVSYLLRLICLWIIEVLRWVDRMNWVIYLNGLLSCLRNRSSCPCWLQLSV